ncbi:hypothetical protein F5888DRAFT_1740258 [Russula emetica]|nr:hypothetical protein F5888DRAFT_1740258 [Russula emetica]
MYASSFLPPSPIISWAKPLFFFSFFFHCACLLLPPSKLPSDGTVSNSSRDPGYLGMNGHTHRYWLPSLLKHEYITLYEKAAQMCVSPTPDVVRHVFMLFHGVHSNNVGLWVPVATCTAAEDGATF